MSIRASGPIETSPISQALSPQWRCLTQVFFSLSLSGGTVAHHTRLTRITSQGHDPLFADNSAVTAAAFFPEPLDKLDCNQGSTW